MAPGLDEFDVIIRSCIVFSQSMEMIFFFLCAYNFISAATLVVIKPYCKKHAHVRCC